MFSERRTTLHGNYYLLPLNMYNELVSLNYIMLYGDFRWSIKFSTTFLDNASFEVSKGAKIRNRYNQVPHLTQDTNGKVTNSQ